MLRKIATLALAAGLVVVASPALATSVLFGGNDTGRFWSATDLSDVAPMTSLATGGYTINGLAWDGGNTIYAINDGRFFTIDNAGVKTSINASTLYNANDLVFGPGGVLYGGNNTRLFSIDPSTGVYTSITNSLTYEIKALAYDAVSGTMYGATTGDGGSFYTISTSGVQTLISSSAGNNIYGMAIDPATGTLYGAWDQPVGNSKMYTINKATGVKTEIQGNTDFDGHGLTFVPEPGTMLLLGMGLLGLGISGRKKA